MMWVTIHRADMGLQGMRTGLQTGSQVQAEPGNPHFLLSCITGLGEPPSFVSVTPLTTSSVLIQWQVRAGKGRVFPELVSGAGTCPQDPVTASECWWQVRGHHVVGVPTWGEHHGPHEPSCGKEPELGSLRRATVTAGLVESIQG